MSDFDSRNENNKPEPGSLADLFADAEFIFVYTREQAIADGTLVDVTETAKQAGFVFPVAVTSALWNDIEDIPAAYAHESIEGRLWDVLMMAVYAIRQSKDGSEMVYPLILHTSETSGEDDEYRVKLVCGPGDTAEPVMTLMKPDED